MSRPKNAAPNARRVVRLHGELYAALCTCAARLGQRPATLAAAILSRETSGNCTSLREIHPFTEAYLPTHNPRVCENEKAHMVTITLPPETFETIAGFAQSALPEAGGAPGTDRQHHRAFLRQQRLLTTNCLVAWLDREGAL